MGTYRGGLSEIYTRQAAELEYCERIVRDWGTRHCKIIFKKENRPDVRIKWSQVAKEAQLRLQPVTE
jgi:hypothetical protein